MLRPPRRTPPLKRRGGSPPPGSPASIPPSKIPRKLASDRPGPAENLTPHTARCWRAHARAEPVVSTTYGDFERLWTPDSCLTECMLQDTACMLRSIRVYRIEFRVHFFKNSPESIHGFRESIRRSALEHTPARTGFRARGDPAVSDGGRSLPSSRGHRAASRSMPRLPKRSKSRSSVSRTDTPKSRHSAAIWASKTRLPVAPASRTASRSRSG